MNNWGLFRAEWRKLTGNRWMVGCFVWLWPIAAALVSGAFIVFALWGEENRQSLVEDPTAWTDATVYLWAVPNSIIGRLLIIGLTAALFGGEYQWGTWRNLMTRRRRSSLILVKFFTVSMFVILAFGLTTLVWVIGIGTSQLIAGAGYPPALDEIPAEYPLEIGLTVLVAFISTLILSAGAALAALITRSSFGAVILGVAIAMIDPFISAGLLMIYWATGLRIFPSLYRFSVTYNIDNLLNYAAFGDTVQVIGNLPQDNPVFGSLMIDPPLAGNPPFVSLMILVGWAIGLIGLAVYTFNRQDLR